MKLSRSRARGSVLVEFALILPTAMLLTLGIVNSSLILQQATDVAEAARAGAQYGVTEGFQSNVSGMRSAALAAGSSIRGMNASASTWCTCASGGAAVPCTVSCNTADPPLRYVQVQTDATAQLFFRWDGFPLSIPLRGKCVLRAQ